MQEGQASQARSSSPLASHRSAFASSPAKRRLPTPGGPVKRYPWARRPRCTARANARTWASCPRIRSQDTADLLTDSSVDLLDCPGCVHDNDLLWPAPGLVEEAFADALVVLVGPALHAVGRTTITA